MDAAQAAEFEKGEINYAGTLLLRSTSCSYLYLRCDCRSLTQKYDLIPRKHLEAGWYPQGKEYLEGVDIDNATTVSEDTEGVRRDTPQKKKRRSTKPLGRPKGILPPADHAQRSLLTYLKPHVIPKPTSARVLEPNSDSYAEANSDSNDSRFDC